MLDLIWLVPIIWPAMREPEQTHAAERMFSALIGNQQSAVPLEIIPGKAYLLLMKQLPIFDEEQENLKRYYSISEVAELFDISKSQIRFWESEFDFLRPHKNSKGDRRFTPDNIKQLQVIHHLLKEKGFTLDGAKRELKEMKARQKQQEAVVGRLKEIRDFLEGLKEEL